MAGRGVGGDDFPGQAHRRAPGAPQVSHKMVWHHMPDVFSARLAAAARAGLGGPPAPAVSEDASARDAGSSGGGGGGGRGGGPGDQGRGGGEMRRPLLSSGVPR
jgi:hypothetical protein